MLSQDHAISSSCRNYQSCMYVLRFLTNLLKRTLPISMRSNLLDCNYYSRYQMIFLCLSYLKVIPLVNSLEILLMPSFYFLAKSNEITYCIKSKDVLFGSYFKQINVTISPFNDQKCRQIQHFYVYDVIRLLSMSEYYLYIDHQQLAPLIRQLEDVLEKVEEELDTTSPTQQLRARIYQEFVTIIYTLYNQNYKDIKLQDPETPLIYNPFKSFDGDLPHTKQQKQAYEDIQEDQKKVKTRTSHNLQAQILLVQWIMSCNKNTFDKKQIVEKHGELSKSSKKKLTIDNIMNLLEKYKLRQIIVRGKQGKQYFVKEEVDESLSIIPKEQDFSKEFSKRCQWRSMQENQGAQNKCQKNTIEEQQPFYSVNLDDWKASGEQKDIQNEQQNIVVKNDQS